MNRPRPLDAYPPDELFTVALNLMLHLHEESLDPEGMSMDVDSLPGAIHELSQGPWLNCNERLEGFGVPWALELELLDLLLVRLGERTDNPRHGWRSPARGVASRTPSARRVINGRCSSAVKRKTTDVAVSRA